jgi:hypothetical protein
MYNPTFTNKGARKYDASATAQTGSFLAIQVIASSSLLNVPNSPIHAGKGYLVPASQSFAKFANVTWGNAKDSSPDTSEQVTNLTVLGGERIEGPIYGFTMTTGSCLAYLF